MRNFLTTGLRNFLTTGLRNFLTTGLLLLLVLGGCRVARPDGVRPQRSGGWSSASFSDCPACEGVGYRFEWERDGGGALIVQDTGDCATCQGQGVLFQLHARK